MVTLGGKLFISFFTVQPQLVVSKCALAGKQKAELARRFGVMSIPTLVVFKNGEETAKSIGFVDKSGLAALVEK